MRSRRGDMMKKSLYSLTLFDDLVEEIDKLAYMRNSNRSQLVNDILASFLGVKTPEQKIKQVIEQLTARLEDTLVVRQVNEASSVQLGTYLKFKYNPTIQYSYEFISFNNRKYAILKISSRTKSNELMILLEKFFLWLCQMDLNFCEDKNVEVDYDPTKNRFTRVFKELNIQGKESAFLSNYLSSYVKMVDHCLEHYFAHLNGLGLEKQLKAIYKKYFINNVTSL